MTDVIAILGLALLFVLFGFLWRGRCAEGSGACGSCAKTGCAQRVQSEREIAESNHVRS